MFVQSRKSSRRLSDINDNFRKILETKPLYKGHGGALIPVYSKLDKRMYILVAYEGWDFFPSKEGALRTIEGDILVWNKTNSGFDVLTSDPKNVRPAVRYSPKAVKIYKWFNLNPPPEIQAQPAK
jgi:hypothetical protein